MQKKKARIALLIVFLLLLIPVSFTMTDKILYENGKRAIFVWNTGGGGEVIEYQGFCYRINYYYPLTSIEDDTQGVSSDWKWFWE